MPILIDGNNLLYAARALNPSEVLLGRQMLCDLLGTWAERRRERVHIVFDGPSHPGDFSKQLGHPAITLTFSGAASADHVLIEHLEADSAARRVIVVSTDREIARAARRRRATSIRSDDFWRMLQNELSRPAPPPGDPPEKRHGLPANETDRWLAEFGFDRAADDDDPNPLHS